METKNSRTSHLAKRLTGEDALAVIDNKWEDSIPVLVKRKCKIIFLAQFKKNAFKRDALSEVESYSKRIAVILTGLIYGGQMQESELEPLFTEEEILVFIREKLGFDIFSMHLKNIPKKLEYLTKSVQTMSWKRLNNFTIDPKHKYRIKSEVEYVEEYRNMLVDIKARMQLVEIIDNNASAEYRASMFYKIKENRDDAKVEYGILYRAVFSHLLITSYNGGTNKKLKTLDDFQQLRSYCLDANRVFEGLKHIFTAAIKSEKITNVVIALPELLEYLEKLNKVALNGTLRKFISFFKQVSDTSLADRLWHYTAMIGKWRIHYDNQHPSTHKWHDNYFSIPKLSRVFGMLPETEFTYMLSSYQHLGVFLSKVDVIRYLLTETDENNRAKVLSFVNPTLVNQAKLSLGKAYTLREVITNYMRTEESDDLSVKEVLRVLSLTNKWKRDSDKTEKRARAFIVHALAELPFEESLELVAALTARNAATYKILPESYRVYLWYKFKGSEDRIYFTKPDDCVDYIQPADIERYLRFKKVAIQQQEQTAAATIAGA